MKAFRKHVAVALDGGGIKGVICTKALSILEQHLGKSSQEIFRIAVGTSTGSIISSGIGCGMSAKELTELYVRFGQRVFPRSWRTTFWPLSRYKYPKEPIEELLKDYFGDRKVGDFWTQHPQMDIVITTFDMKENRTRFIKPWKLEYVDWPLIKAIRSSCTVPTFFPVPDGRYVDGGVGSFANPCYYAAYEAVICLNWDPKETTIISLGTGRDPYNFDPAKTPKMFAWNWVMPMFGAFLNSAEDQQVHLVDTFFQDMDFRRFQVNLSKSMDMDDPSNTPQLIDYGKLMGDMILNDQTDRAMHVVAKRAF
jgi:predicted acylesterase/phospholipase RssA